jgi:hypothetical protein
MVVFRPSLLSHVDHETRLPLRKKMEERISYAVLTKVSQELNAVRQFGNTIQRLREEH